MITRRGLRVQLRLSLLAARPVTDSSLGRRHHLEADAEACRRAWIASITCYSDCDPAAAGKSKATHSLAVHVVYDRAGIAAALTEQARGPSETGIDQLLASFPLKPHGA